MAIVYAKRSPGSRGLIVACCVLLATLLAFGQASPLSVSGVVEDPSGAVVVGASVEFSSGSYHVASQPNSVRQFRLEPSAGTSTGTISAKNKGYLPVQRPWNGETQVKLVLQPQLDPDYVTQHVLVTANRIDTELEILRQTA